MLAYLQTTDKRIRLVCLLAGLMVWATILLSFSRGGYMAVVICGILFLVMLFIKDKSASEKTLSSRWIAGVCFILLTSVLCWHYQAEVAQTFRMNETLSQQRSAAGRLGTGVCQRGNRRLSVGSGQRKLHHRQRLLPAWREPERQFHLLCGQHGGKNFGRRRLCRTGPLCSCHSFSVCMAGPCREKNPLDGFPVPARLSHQGGNVSHLL